MGRTTVLRQIVSFVAVPPLAKVDIAHAINVDNIGQIPDRITAAVKSGGLAIVVTANDATVSVTNQGSVAVDVDCYLYLDHSIDRAFPGGEGVTGLVPRPFIEVVQAGSSGGATGATIERFVAAGGEQDFNVPLTIARTTDKYSVFPAQAGMASIVGIDCPDLAAGDRTVALFRVITSAALTAGDTIDFLVMDR